MIDVPVTKSATVFRGAPARCMTEPVTKLSREMPIVAKTARICNFAERQTGAKARAKARAALQKTRGVFQTKRIDEFMASRAPLRK